MNLFLDTSICIDVLRTYGPDSSISLFKAIEDTCVGYISTISVAELFAGVYLSKKRDAAEKTDALLSLLEVIDLNSEIAHDGGRIYAVLSRSGKQIEFNDCLIAVTAKWCGFNSIVTRNIDHFTRIEGISAVLPEDLIPVR
ncbi:MAG: type II toxin-antitoxin system VapC family toxin [Methanobacteriota archaeon]